MLEAKLRADYSQSKIRALEGRIYVKFEFRPIPVEREDEARRHSDLEVREATPAPIPVEPTYNPPPLLQETETDNPQLMTKQELRARLMRLGVIVPGKADRSELIDLLTAAMSEEAK